MQSCRGKAGSQWAGVRGPGGADYELGFGRGGESLREVGGGEVYRGEREEEDGRGKKEEKRERREGKQRQISSEIQ